jgi:hypothetical protein
MKYLFAFLLTLLVGCQKSTPEPTERIQPTTLNAYFVCQFDNPVHDGDWVIASMAEAGKCHAIQKPDGRGWEIVIGKFSEAKNAVQIVLVAN